MPSVSKFAPASQRKRLAYVLVAALLCTMIVACGNDDADTNGQAANTGSTSSSSDANNTSATVAANASTNPSQTDSTPPLTPTLTIQTPPASNTGAAMSSAAPEPLATPVIHTVD